MPTSRSVLDTTAWLRPTISLAMAAGCTLYDGSPGGSVNSDAKVTIPAASEAVSATRLSAKPDLSSAGRPAA